MLTLATICSGIGAPEVAGEGLFAPLWCAEIEPSACAVLHERWGVGRPQAMPQPDPDILRSALAAPPKERTAEHKWAMHLAAAIRAADSIPDGAGTNLGDMTAPDFVERALAIGRPDLLVAGTPCQAFSVAGKRKSLDDDRGNLTLRFVEIIEGLDDGRLVVFWENVPGVLSTKDNAFGCFLAALAGEDSPLVPVGGRWTDAGLVVGPKRAAAWRVLDAQFFGLAQRRERVFVVASADPRVRPEEILFEFAGVRRDSAPHREAGEGAAASLTRGADSQNQRDEVRDLNDCAGALASKPGMKQQTYVAIPILEAGKRTGKSTTDKRAGMGVGDEADPMFTLQSGAQHAVAFSICGREGGAQAEVEPGGIAPVLRNSAGGGGQHTFVCAPSREVASALTGSYGKQPDNSDTGLGPTLAIQTDVTPKAGDVAFTLKQPSASGGGQPAAVMSGMAVRRLTPVECERLQGLPDDWTQAPFRGKPMADGPRYRMIGNSMAAAKIRWVLRRIHGALVEEMQ